MDIDDFIRHWDAVFIPWVRAKHLDDLAEVMTDCSSELFANSLTAMHLRKFARENGPENFWCRCEWEKYDVSFGTTEQPIENWERDFENKNITMHGAIEGKVTYWHYGKAKTTELFQTLRQQLAVREADRFGLIWLISYAAGEDRQHLDSVDAERNAGWENVFRSASLTPLTPAGHTGGPFVLVGRRDMKDVWPLARPAVTSVSVALASFNE